MTQNVTQSPKCQRKCQRFTAWPGEIVMTQMTQTNGVIDHAQPTRQAGDRCVTTPRVALALRDCLLYRLSYIFRLLAYGGEGGPCVEENGIEGTADNFFILQKRTIFFILQK